LKNLKKQFAIVAHVNRCNMRHFVAGVGKYRTKAHFRLRRRIGFLRLQGALRSLVCKAHSSSLFAQAHAPFRQKA